MKIIKNNYAPNNVRTTCPICDSIFEFDPTTECDKEEYRDEQHALKEQLFVHVVIRVLSLEGNILR